MKKQTSRRSSRTKKLRLSRETVKKLDVDQLEQVHGGGRDDTNAPGISKCTCW